MLTKFKGMFKIVLNCGLKFLKENGIVLFEKMQNILKIKFKKSESESETTKQKQREKTEYEASIFPPTARE